MNIPEELRYTKEHEWARIEGNIAQVGITDFAVEQLGDITLVELPEVGQGVEAGESIGAIESVKAVSDLYSPFSGTITEVNDGLEDAPEKVNDDPYGDGWLLKIEVADLSEISSLLDSDDYQTQLDAIED